MDAAVISESATTPRDPQVEGYHCCLCGGREFRRLHFWEADHPRNSASIPLGFWECTCGLAFLYPIPGPAELPLAGEWWTGTQRDVFRRVRLKSVRVRLQNWLFGTQRQRLIRQTRRILPSGRLLDVGCGTGELLDCARPHFECTGVEPSPRAAAVARSKGFAIMEHRFEDAPLPRAAFDVVTLDAVLEHVADPVRVLRKIHGLLGSGGVVVIKVPKLWGPSHRRHGREWNGFRVGYHTVMFSGQTLRETLNAAGFESLRSPSRDRAFDDILMLWGRKVGTPSG